MRQSTEDGFRVFVVKDATAGPQHPELGEASVAVRTLIRVQAFVIRPAQSVSASSTTEW